MYVAFACRAILVHITMRYRFARLSSPVSRIVKQHPVCQNKKSGYPHSSHPALPTVLEPKLIRVTQMIFVKPCPPNPLRERSQFGVFPDRTVMALWTSAKHITYLAVKS